ncbi:Pseudouridine-5'-phosphate glycosidase [Orchesella cincta]|uniref:Pseudouridine-5'-phosphate glycosidase n=1 Tax=Orchesella cincta TaxID=48709 RepID=A0A1D2MQ18_ORCCI|nr:Pseudouridine-5'-phosphate glycosidase [Orchesella cincta]
MMRLVISPRHHHFGQQQGFYKAITTLTPPSKVQINWTFTRSRCSRWSLDKRNNEQTFSPRQCLEGHGRDTTIPTLLVSSSIKSCSPLVSPPHILPSIALSTRVQVARERKAKGLLSSSAPHSLARRGESRCCGVVGLIQGRFLHQMSIPHRRLHSSSPKSLLSTPTTFAVSSSSLPSRSHHHSPGENSEFFHISPEVREALEGNVPVVALESAIITHGMPFPDNVDTAFRLERIIREYVSSRLPTIFCTQIKREEKICGVVPATIGVVNGCLTVGLTMKEIESLGEWAKHRASGNTKYDSNPPTVKVSRRDLPFAMSHKLNGGTTVSGTIIGAVKAGIPIFATGGLGGVHRGAETSFDISADLKELGRNPIAVISAGVKSILDIGKTLEYMETEGICVAVLQVGKQSENDGSTDQKETIASAGGVASLQQQIGTVKFPSFFTAQSQFPAPYSIQNETEAASLIQSAFQFQLDSGVLIAVPIPKEHEGAGKMIEDAIKSALKEAEKLSVKGKDMTPFLLGEVSRLTGGESLKANKHLIENNVTVASKIAAHLARLRSAQTSASSSMRESKPRL